MKNSSEKQYKPPIAIMISGATASDGKPYVRVKASRKERWVPREAFAGSGNQARTMLMEAGMPFLTAEWGRCMEKVAKLRLYPNKPLIDQVGWNGAHFALPDGTVFGYPSVSQPACPVVLFRTSSQKCGTAGTISQWRTITRTLKRQPLATFILLTGYVGPFLRLTSQALNQGFELAGPGGVGKSTIQRLAAAVCGPADSPTGANYWITANATINGLERVMAEHNDMPLILEEANLFAAADHAAKRAARFNELVFKLADGTPKLRFGSASVQRSRFVFTISTNEPLSQVLFASRAAVAEAAADRLLTIPIEADRQHGIFDSVPWDFPGSGALAEYLKRSSRECFGVGIRRLLQRLTAEVATDRQCVEVALQHYMEAFRREVGVDGNDGSETRVADAFGLVFAAGMFAIRYGAVSRRLDPLGAAKLCYDLNKRSRAKPLNLAKQVRWIAGDFDTIEVEHHRLPELTDDEIDEAPAILRIGRNGRKEVLFTERQLIRAFGNLRAFFADPEIRGMMINEGGRKQTKRQVRRNRKADRFFCFRLADHVLI